MPPASRKRAASPYDADNRVDVDGGDLVNGQIQVVARTGSMEHEYDQAGNVVKQLSNDGTGLKTQTFGYDARGEQIGGTLTGGVQESRQYDADGRLTADVYAYAATATASYTNADGTFSLPIGGWLVSATTYYYNADGEVTATFDYSRDTSNADYWNVLGRQRDNDTLDTVAQQTVPATVPTLR